MNVRWLQVLLALVTLGSAFSARAEVVSDEWMDLLRNIQAGGERVVYGSPNYAAYTIKRGTSFDVERSRDVAYLSLVGVLDGAGRFRARKVSLVEESWVSEPEGVWRVDQRLTTISLSGEVNEVIDRKIRLQGTTLIGDIPEKTLDAELGRVLWLAQRTGWMQLAEQAAGGGGPVPAPTRLRTASLR